VISLDLPRRPARRPATRVSLHAVFGGAATNRLTQDWFASLLSADRETKSSLRTLRARSRQLFRDNSHCAGFRYYLTDHVLSSEGITLSPRVRFGNGNLRKELGDTLFALWTEWGAPEICSADGLTSWSDLERLVLGMWAMDGEVLIRRLGGFGNQFGYALQVLDPDLLDESFNRPPGQNQNEITQGIEIDGFGRPVAYHLWRSHPSDSQRIRERVRIPAGQILHLYVPWRAGQHRGIPILTPGMIAMRMLDGYTEAEVTQARIAASQGGFFTMTGQDAETLGVAESATVETADGAPEPLVLEAEAGLARQLPPGWKFDEWDPTHPNANFAEFNRAMLHVIARAVGASYIGFSGDLSSTSFSSGRTGLIAERRGLRALQRWFARRFHDVIYRDFLRFGNLAGAIPLPSPEPSKYCTCRWDLPGFDWIDPEKDLDAAIKSVALRINSPQRIAAEQGRDYEEIVEEIAEAMRINRENGVEWVDPAQKVLRGSSPAAPARETEDLEETLPSPPRRNGNGNGNGRAAAGHSLRPYPEVTS